MRLATIRTPDGTHAARIVGDRALVLSPSDVGELLGRSEADRAAQLEAVGELALSEVSFAPLVPHPDKIFCVGMNYRSHIAEMSRDVPAYPTLFAKFASSLLGANDDLVLSSVSDSIDWEAELGVVIGRPIRRATIEQAREAIFGFTVVNDVSMRDWQNRTTQYLQGKAFDHSTPVGPVLVTGEEIGYGADLEVRCELDGVVMQRGRTSDMLFDPAAVVSYISQFATLRPGDLISTGTPSGVGAGRKPPVFLSPDQILVTSIEGIGSCRNRCVAEVDLTSA